MQFIFILGFLLVIISQHLERMGLNAGELPAAYQTSSYQIAH